jgi:hypothetical protein
MIGNIYYNLDTKARTIVSWPTNAYKGNDFKQFSSYTFHEYACATQCLEHTQMRSTKALNFWKNLFATTSLPPRSTDFRFMSAEMQLSRSANMAGYLLKSFSLNILAERGVFRRYSTILTKTVKADTEIQYIKLMKISFYNK